MRERPKIIIIIIQKYQKYFFIYILFLSNFLHIKEENTSTFLSYLPPPIFTPKISICISIAITFEFVCFCSPPGQCVLFHAEDLIWFFYPTLIALVKLPASSFLPRLRPKEMPAWRNLFGGTGTTYGIQDKKVCSVLFHLYRPLFQENTILMKSNGR